MSYPQLEITYEKPPRNLVLLKEINTYTLTGFTRIKTPHLMNQQSVLRTLVGWKKEVQCDSWKLAPAHPMRSSYEGQAETRCWKVGGGSPGLPGSSLGSSFPNKVTERDTNALVEFWNFRCSLQNPARCGAIRSHPYLSQCARHQATLGWVWLRKQMHRALFEPITQDSSTTVMVNLMYQLDWAIECPIFG